MSSSSDEPKPTIWRWLLPLLIALIALWLLSSLFGRKDAPMDTTPPATVEPAPAPEPTPAPLEAPPSASGAPSANLYFDVGSADLPADATGGLEPVVAWLKANPSTIAVVSGYHDPTGDQAVNEELAKGRADSVRNALVGAGVDEARIDMQKPIVTTGGGSLEDARRVEVTVR
jgi:outer membrane protein OmpA-like peptidoglycan-associated protein